MMVSFQGERNLGPREAFIPTEVFLESPLSTHPYHCEPTTPPESQVSNEEGNYFWSPGA